MPAECRRSSDVVIEICYAGICMGLPKVFLTAEWKYIVMLNYEIEPKIIEPLVPSGTELDTWNGKTFVSIVGFLFLKTKVRGIPIPFHRNFEEVNLRFYVGRFVEGETRRGVVFIKELVPRLAIAATARLLYNEKYYSLPMDHVVDPGKGFFEYRWKSEKEWQYLQAKTIGDPQLLISGSQEEFISEHYWGYTAQKNGTTMEYRVEHPRWHVWQVNQSVLKCDVSTVYGPEYEDAFRKPASSVFVAEGSSVAVHKGINIG
jgi:uncharacterized protein YqjF (DUF2071 family)